ncbi:MAG: tripartite tricarboxylate transporter permease, partial [Synergistaceae bacterium]|nr:tripartite tricarboxylate transporter permease [Synergistaceae bacterium]
MILNLGLALLGTAVGIIFGAIPGMTATMAVAVFLPMTYAFQLVPALYLLLGLYVGGISGGLIPAILINVPGTPSSVCTGFDGYPMARRGESERALKIGITASFLGGMISLIVLALLTPPLAKMAIKFSAIEKFLIILFAMTVIAALSKGSMTKGVFAGFLGVLLSLVGELAMNNKMRMVPSFLSDELRSGFQLLPLLIGLFAICQMFQEAEKGMQSNNLDEGVTVEGAKKFSFSDFKGQTVNVIRSSLLGTFMGILPGVGGSAASLIAYSQAKSFSKNPDMMGKGAPEGLIASESSNNGLTGGALVPLLSLGIPGDATTAVLIGAFLLQGIQVGPLFIGQHPDIWNQILLALCACNILMF